MRGEDHADLPLGHRFHQVLQELAAGQRVQAGHRLVQDQQPGPLGQGQGQGELGPLSPGQLARPLAGIQVEPLDAVLGVGGVPAGVEVSAEAQMIGHAQAGVDRGVLSHETDLGQLIRPAVGLAVQHGDRAGVRGQQAHGQVEQG